MIPNLLLLLLISLVAAPTSADQHTYYQSHFDISGYVGYQYVYGSPDPAPIKSSPEIGLLIHYEIADDWTAFTQFRLEPDHMEQSVAYAFIEYDGTLFDTVPLQITTGKLRHQYGLYNKDRLNPRTRPGNVAPQAIYWDQLRFALTSGWGVSVGSSWGDWQIKYAISAPIIVNKKDESLIWFSGAPMQVETKFGGHQQINLDYIADDWRIVTTVTLQDWGHGDYGKNTIISLGGEKRLRDVTLSLEGMLVLKEINKSYGISATIQYDIHDYVTLHTNYNRYEVIFNDKPTHYLKHATNSHDISVGISLHKDEWEMRTEFHAAKGSVWVDFREARNPEFADWWHYGAVSLVYHF